MVPWGSLVPQDDELALFSDVIFVAELVFGALLLLAFDIAAHEDGP